MTVSKEKPVLGDAPDFVAAAVVDPEKRPSSDASVEYAAHDDYDSPEDRKLLRKIDRRSVNLFIRIFQADSFDRPFAIRLLPALTLLYLLSFLDRTNVGNAKLDGLTIDLHISAPAYNTSLALYFIAYVTFEVPANVGLLCSSFLVLYQMQSNHIKLTIGVIVSLKRFDPQFWLPFLTLIWGIVSICQGLVTNQAGFFGIRYRILAFVIGKMDGIGGKRGWQWIFIIEGLLTVVVSAGAFFFVPTWSHKAKFALLAADSDAAHLEKFSWVYVRQAFTDHLVWGYALLFHGFAFVLYTLSLFLPTIIADLGFVTWKAQLMTIPPNVVATLGIWSGAWLAARTKTRAPLIIGSAAIAIVGYIIMLSTHTREWISLSPTRWNTDASHLQKAGAQYTGVHFAALGVYTGNALLLSWPSENISGQTKRAVGVAMQITIGDLGAVTGVLLYRPAYSAHHFRKPHIISIGYLVFSVAVASYLWTWMARENRRRSRLIAEGRAEHVDREAKVHLGDRDVYWKYQI
ncbi:hypothetical protein EW146_g4101 [Bondarzewia mesenterica]|uniref:Major facilitator superfamily (MFS) profile domain-containing protein n=1 Tax=Bondarzewia mesenterica TaxID=1095465 RepID=A0A4S4LVK7_9AGAM|nr:hypothetical protein EW146_g4101 [Bondarzewia mesenterica]